MAVSTITMSDFSVPGTQGYSQVYEVTAYDEDGAKNLKTFSSYEKAQEHVDSLKSANPSAEVIGEINPPPTQEMPAGMTPIDPDLPLDSEWQSNVPDPPASPLRAPSGKERYLNQLKKRAIDRRNTGEEEEVSKAEIAELRKKGVSGVFGTRRIQPKINRINVPSESVYRGKDNNAFIIIGNDRTGHKATGYGGFGHTQCDSIDLAAGVGGPKPKRYDRKMEYIN